LIRFLNGKPWVWEATKTESEVLRILEIEVTDSMTQERLPLIPTSLKLELRVITQKQEGEERIIDIVSRTLNKAEKNYAVHEGEALAVTWYRTKSHLRVAQSVRSKKGRPKSICRFFATKRHVDSAHHSSTPAIDGPQLH